MSEYGVELCPLWVRARVVESKFLGSKFGGSKSEKLSFHLASCNMQLLANYTKYYTVDGVSQEVLIN